MGNGETKNRMMRTDALRTLKITIWLAPGKTPEDAADVARSAVEGQILRDAEQAEAAKAGKGLSTRTQIDYEPL